MLSGIGSPVNLPARTVILPGEADSPPTLAGAPTAPFVTAPPGVAPASFDPKLLEFASLCAASAASAVLQQANAAGSRVAPQPPQPYTLDSNIVAPGTVSVQQARPPAGFAFAKETAQRSVADWLAQVEHFCVSMRVAHPVALAGNYLEGGALLWYLHSIFNALSAFNKIDFCSVAFGGFGSLSRRSAVAARRRRRSAVAVPPSPFCGWCCHRCPGEVAPPPWLASAGGPCSKFEAPSPHST